jgi:2-keto-3-deoxy-L-rhamnonate aldolase RhmA
MIGGFLNLGSAVTAELMALAGFDWLAIDLEHGLGDEQLALAQIQALERTNTAALVRVESSDRIRIGRVLDMGAAGVIVPRIEGPEEAERAAAACCYAGSRGVARQTRNWHWGLASMPLAAADEDIVCMVQIETRSALEAVNEIAAIDGVDVLFLGPNDLAHSLGIAGGPDADELLEQARAVVRATMRHDKAAGVLVPTEAYVRAYSDLGFTVVGCATDAGLLARGVKTVIDDVKESLAGRGEDRPLPHEAND